LLKTQGTNVWWKIRGQKFIDDLCVTLRRQHSANVVRCANWGRPIRWLFTRDTTFFTPLPYPWTDGASCWLRSRRNPRWVSVIDPVRINSSTGHTRSLTPQRSMLTKSEGHCLCLTL
jgi:hypothetical protein